MKTYIKITIIVLLSAAALHGATLTIEVPDASVPRILEAYGSIYNLGRNATPAEVQTMIQGWLQNSTLDYERRKDMAQFSPPPVYSPTPTATPGELRAAQAAVSPTLTPKKKK